MVFSRALVSIASIFDTETTSRSNAVPQAGVDRSGPVPADQAQQPVDGKAVLDAAYLAQPERFHRGPPRAPALPAKVWINPTPSKIESEGK